jgi:hypothetical protein
MGGTARGRAAPPHLGRAAVLRPAVPAVKEPHDALNHRHVSARRRAREAGERLVARQHEAVEVDGGAAGSGGVVEAVQKICCGQGAPTRTNIACKEPRHGAGESTGGSVSF